MTIDWLLLLLFRRTAISDSYGPAVRALLSMYKISASSVPASGPHNRLLKGQVSCMLQARVGSGALE